MLLLKDNEVKGPEVVLFFQETVTLLLFKDENGFRKIICKEIMGDVTDPSQRL